MYSMRFGSRPLAAWKMNFMAPIARTNVKQICIATTPQALKDALQQAKDAGADDVLLVPTTSDPDDVNRVADILG